MSGRTKIIAGLALLVAVWVAAAGPAVTDAVRLTSERVGADRLDRPIGEVVLALEGERRDSAAARPDAEVTAQRGRTDQAIARLRQARDGGFPWPTESDADRRADELLRRTGGLAELRAMADGERADRGQLVAAYAEIIHPAGAASPTVSGGPADGLVALSRSRELLAEEDALLAAASGEARLSDTDRVRLSVLAGARRSLFAAADAGLPAKAAGRHRALAGDAGLARLRTMEDELMLASGSVPTGWTPTFNQVNSALWELQESAAQEAADAGTPHAVLVTAWAGLVGGVGLVAVLAVLVATRRAAGRGDDAGRTGLTGLTGWTGRRGRADDSSRTTPGTPPNGHREPLEDLLQDLDRRNQGLLHRQLRLLDALARRENDDETLDDLFRADHLATRMRRNLEKAITLTGGTPGRRWRRPVPMGEVIRGAAAEIADHERVSTAQIEPAHLAGPAVLDLMHLLAELVENAATFAPAETRVRVTGTHTEAGYRVAVHDVGPGMTADDLVTAHQVMGDPDPPGRGTWWGLYAAGRFAARHGLTVGLRNGDDGGLVAEVEIPAALVVVETAFLAEAEAEAAARAGTAPSRDGDGLTDLEAVSNT